MIHEPELPHAPATAIDPLARLLAFGLVLSNAFLAVLLFLQWYKNCLVEMAFQYEIGFGPSTLRICAVEHVKWLPLLFKFLRQ